MTGLAFRFSRNRGPAFSSALLLAFFLVLIALLPAAPAAAAEPTSVVEKFHGQLLEVMKSASQLGLKGRYDKLAPAVEGAYDFPGMLQAAVGTDWQKATDDQRNRLLDAFKRISIGTYAVRFDGYSGESFKTVQEKPGPSGTILVSTQIVRPSDSPVGLTYVLRKGGERWGIIDVLLDNAVSELAVRRSEYRRIIQDKGIDGLISTLADKAREVMGD
jgi:phospholipid transport system substrate-binding protein